MFDTMTMTKVLGGVCGALLIYLLGGWAAESIYHSGNSHGDEIQGYVIAVESSAEPEIDTGPSFEELMASADPDAGARVFRKCSACHKVDEGANGTGPTLYKVVNRPSDSIAEFSYSGALETVVDIWTPEHLNGFLEKPSAYAPGTSMGFGGLSKAKERADLIAYLETL